MLHIPLCISVRGCRRGGGTPVTDARAEGRGLLSVLERTWFPSKSRLACNSHQTVPVWAFLEAVFHQDSHPATGCGSGLRGPNSFPHRGTAATLGEVQMWVAISCCLCAVETEGSWCPSPPSPYIPYCCRGCTALARPGVPETPKENSQNTAPLLGVRTTSGRCFPLTTTFRTHW